MKAKHLISTILCSLPLVLASCDGGSSKNDSGSRAERNNSVALSLDQTELRTGDSITFTTSDNTAPTLDDLELNRTGVTISGSAIFQYAKTDDHLFTITRTSTVNLTDRLEAALITTLSGLNTNPLLNSQLRTLLRRDEAVFTPEELDQIAEILNPNGTNLNVTDTGELIAADSDLHTMLVTSIVGDQINGSMGGTYSVTSNGTFITFRHPTDLELRLFRFMSSDDWIPILDNKSTRNVRTEAGTWTMKLSSSIL